MNIKKIQELVEIMNENDLNEVEIEDEGMKIRLIKSAYGKIEHVAYPAGAPAREGRPAAAEAAAQAEETPKNVKEIKSPMVGTFYRSPSPDADPYVSIGTVVKKGDVLCIVEAMKLMNEVKSEINGRVVDVLVENAEPIEFGQTLFLIEPA